MERYGEAVKSQTLFVGIDVHKTTYHVTGVLGDGHKIFDNGMDADKEGLVTFLKRQGFKRIESVYEAGCFGYSLHDYLIEHGVNCMVTPPSLVPGEYGNRVKTDRRDSHKLALYLAKGLLKRVHVPSSEERSHRQVIRTRRQLVDDRKRKQNQIMSFLSMHGIELPETESRWSKRYVARLTCIRFPDTWLQKCFKQLLDAYKFCDQQVADQTKLLEELARTDRYRDRVALLESIPGIGTISAMEFLLELQDVARFRTAGNLAAYVGLTPSQYSSGDKVRMGRITRIGKSHLRATWIEGAWTLIKKDTHANRSTNEYAPVPVKNGR